MLDEAHVLDTNENYRGLSYGDLITMWQKWLMSDNPDRTNYGDILFLRGSIGHHANKSVYLRASVRIEQGTAILVPIVTTHYNLGEKYEGSIIKNVFSLKKAVKAHVDAAGPFWATLEKFQKPSIVLRLVKNIQSFRVESQPFELDISDKNPFLCKMDIPLTPGRYTALVSGYFILLRDLPACSYRLRFGGYGMNRFYTDSVYKIKVTERETNPWDISGFRFTANHSILRKKKPCR